MPAAPVMQTAVKARAGDPLRQVARLDPARLVAVVARHAVAPVPELARLSRIHREQQKARLPIALDAKAPAARVDQIDAFDGHGPDAPGFVDAELLLDDGRVAGEAGDHLPAIAP